MELKLVIFCYAFIPAIVAWHGQERRKLCHYPCQCQVRELNCGQGISVVKDGCDCCYMCARQHGDLCNVKDMCDPRQGLYCDRTGQHGATTGICRAKSMKPCIVDGKTYADGERFKLECSQLCTCQNGNYGCVNLCPDEYRQPSAKHCSRPRLLSVPGQCCKQWTCETLTTPRPEIIDSGKSPRHLMNTRKRHMDIQLGLPLPLTDVRPPERYQSQQPGCEEKVSPWSHCSADCGIGLSTRSRRDFNCKENLDTRLCFIRPCNVTVSHKYEGKCTPTARTKHRIRVQYQDCRSVRELNFKFCTNCKRNRCCYPQREKTRHIEFECGNKRRETFKFLWIKKCRCDKQCYKQDRPKRYWKNG